MLYHQDEMILTPAYDLVAASYYDKISRNCIKYCSCAKNLKIGELKTKTFSDITAKF